MHPTCCDTCREDVTTSRVPGPRGAREWPGRSSVPTVSPRRPGGVRVPEGAQADPIVSVLPTRCAHLLDSRDDAETREELLSRLERVNDPRGERYFSLLAKINGWPGPESLQPVLDCPPKHCGLGCSGERAPLGVFVRLDSTAAVQPQLPRLREAVPRLPDRFRLRLADACLRNFGTHPVQMVHDVHLREIGVPPRLGATAGGRNLRRPTP